MANLPVQILCTPFRSAMSDWNLTSTLATVVPQQPTQPLAAGQVPDLPWRCPGLNLSPPTVQRLPRPPVRCDHQHCGLVHRRLPHQPQRHNPYPLVRPLGVVVDQVLPHEIIQVPPAEHDEVVEALLLQRLCHPLGVGVDVV